MVQVTNRGDHSDRSVDRGECEVARIWGCGFESHKGPWMPVCCECCVLSGNGLCHGAIRRSEESYKASQCDQVQ